MEKVKIEEFVEMVEKHNPCFLMSARGTSNGDRIGFSFNEITIDNNELTFGLRNSYDGIFFDANDIINLSQDKNCIDFTLKNGEKYTVILGEEKQPKTKYEEIEIDDLISRLKRSLSTSIRFGEQNIYQTRAVYTSFSCSDIDDEIGDRFVSLTFCNGEDHTKIDISECDTTIKLFKDDDYYSVVSLELPEMPNTTLMLFLNYQEITMKIPISFNDLV